MKNPRKWGTANYLQVGGKQNQEEWEDIIIGRLRVGERGDEQVKKIRENGARLTIYKLATATAVELLVRAPLNWFMKSFHLIPEGGGRGGGGGGSVVSPLPLTTT